MHPQCKNKLIVLTTEWLPWLQSYERVIEANCIRQPKRQLPGSSYNHNTLKNLRTSVRESPACSKSMHVHDVMKPCAEFLEAPDKIFLVDSTPGFLRQRYTSISIFFFALKKYK